MTWDTAPAATVGYPGILTTASLEVRELTRPGGAVRVLPGPVAIPNRVDDDGTVYAATLLVEEQVLIAAVGREARSDLIVARMDPEGPVLRVVSNVPADTTTATVVAGVHDDIALARLDLPAGTVMVTQDMLTDLRVLSPDVDESASQSATMAPEEVEQIPPADLFQQVPAGGVLTCTIPSWATHVSGEVAVTGLPFGGQGTNDGDGWDCVAHARIAFAWVGDPGYGPTVPVTLHSDAEVGRFDVTVTAPATFIPANRRGRPLTVALQIARVSADANGDLFLDPGATIDTTLAFTSAPESSAASR